MRKFSIRRKRTLSTIRMILCAVLMTALCSLPIWYIMYNFSSDNINASELKHYGLCKNGIYGE